MFKSVKPAGQPRTVRSIIAAYNDASNFPPDLARQDLPEAKDIAAPAPTARREGAAAKSPFRGIRG
jgi:hypothetical protein